MFSKEIRDMLFQVITSWQVIAVSVGVILYFFLVSYVARFNHQHRTPRSVNATKSKNVSSAPAITSDEEIDTNDELGLEE
jgi:heme/copper-type cytochrome/quinol oxidase subunit 2